MNQTQPCNLLAEKLRGEALALLRENQVWGRSINNVKLFWLHLWCNVKKCNGLLIVRCPLILHLLLRLASMGDTMTPHFSYSEQANFLLARSKLDILCKYSGALCSTLQLVSYCTTHMLKENVCHT